MTPRRLFLDCDGVLADFDFAARKLFDMCPRAFEDGHGSDEFWKRIREADDFYFKLPLMENAFTLHREGWKLIGGRPIILTGYSAKFPTSSEQKHRWVSKIFGPHQEVITCLSAEKSLFMNPGDIIIDDWPEHRDKWVSKGGHWIHHTSAADSIRQLRELLAADSVAA